MFGTIKTGRSFAVSHRRRGQPTFERCRKWGLLLTDREFDVGDPKPPVRPSRIASSVVWFVYQCMSVSFQAETNLQYSLFALQLVERFVTEKGASPDLGANWKT